MKTIFIAITTIFLTTSCAAIDAKRLEKDIDNYVSTVTTICETAELFSAVGKEVPGVYECKEVLNKIDIIRGYGDTLAIADILKCIDKNDLKSVEFAQCVTSVKWWPVLVDRITREAQKMVY